jgi:hypothetical protein
MMPHKAIANEAGLHENARNRAATNAVTGASELDAGTNEASYHLRSGVARKWAH